MAEDKLLFTDPSVLWAQSCAANYRWLAKYAFEIAAEWTERNAVPTTNLRRHIEWLEQNVPAGLDKGPTEVQWDLYPQRVSRWIVDLKLPTITAERLFYLELFRREDVSCYFGYDEVEEPEFLTDENLMAKWQTHLGVKRDRRMEQERLATTLGKRASAELQDKEQQEPSPKCVAVSCE